jgi:polyhydroxybutyrate depolymerase
MRRTLIHGLLVLVVITAAACSSSDGAPEATTDDSTAAPTESSDDTASDSAVAGAEIPCSPAAPGTPGETLEVLSSGGVDRTYRLDVPDTYDGSARAPLFISLHGFNSNAIQQDIYSGLDQAAAEVGGIVATPDGLGAPQGWGLQPEGADAAFVSALIDDLEQRFCVDTTRVAAVGISNGSALSAILGCALADQLSAVGLAAATVGPLDCAPSTRTSVIAFHGTADRTVPYDGGGVTSGGRANGLQVVPAEEGIALWADQDRCAPDPEVDAVAADVDRWEYQGCEDGAAVTFYRVEGAGHVWPGSPIQAGALTERLGANTDSIDASALMVDFVVAHPRRG